MNNAFNCYASSAFGMEGLVSRELKHLCAENVLAVNGGVHFSATGDLLFSLNLRMHFCDRLFIILASEICRSFDQLFELVKSIDWTAFFSGHESIDVSCKCTRSMLMSPRDCQSITKKAIIEKLKIATGQKIYPESGPSLPVHISIRNDQAMILINTSGAALSRRGYRTWNGEAPLRETLASALVELSGWRPGQPLHDPCCGTGTILCEAAMIAAGKAPGADRHFAMESLPIFRTLDFEHIRKKVAAESHPKQIVSISGSDIDPEALTLAHRHLLQAGFSSDSVLLRQIPLEDLTLESEHGVFVCNPPYGERLGDQEHCRKLYRDLFFLKQRHPSWRLCAISSDPAFERSYGKKATKKRRLYNGRLECVYYIYD